MIKVKRYDTAEHLTTKEHCKEYLIAAMEDDELTQELFYLVLNNIVRSAGIEEPARACGIDIADLRTRYADGTMPDFDTILKLTRALGVRLCAVPIEGAAAESSAAAEVPLSPAV